MNVILIDSLGRHHLPTYNPGVELPQWRVPVGVGAERIMPLGLEDFLFDRAEDPAQERVLWDERPEQRARMLGPARDLISAEGASPEQYERLGLQVRR